MKQVIIILMFICTQLANGQTILGKWNTFDEKTKTQKSQVEIYKTDGKYFAKITDLYNLPDNTKPENALCVECKGDKKNKPIIGMNVIEDLVKQGNEYKDGKITDPQNGKTYDCSVRLDPKDSDILIVKGSIGPFSRSQRWKRVH